MMIAKIQYFNMKRIRLFHRIKITMGQGCLKQNLITVASLNFSGINTNPFEYNDGTPFFKELNKNFKHIQELEFPKLQKWEGAILDKNFKTNRFTILFGDELIDQLKDKLFSKEQFDNLWHQHYQSAKQKNLLKGYQPTTEEETNVLLMDYTFYRVVVMTVYSYSSLKDFDQKSPQQNSQKLKNFLINLKKKPQFDLQTKKKYVENYYKDLDVMFLQEAGSVQWDQQEHFHYQQGHDSLIIYRKSIFGQPNQEQNKKWEKELDINNDTAFVFTNKSFLLVSSHFRSTEKQYMEQEKELKAILDKLVLQYDKQLKIIVGLDSNHYLSTLQGNNSYFIQPNFKEISTSIKKRTYIQAQLSKADKPIDELKDHIISSIPINTYQLELIDGNPSDKQLLPFDKHPYDHFIVKAKIQLSTSKGCLG